VREAVTFRRTATELGLAYSALDFEAAFTIDIRGRQGNRSVRPHFQTVRVRAVVSTAESLEKLDAVIEETEARCPVLNLLLDALATAAASRSRAPLPAAPQPALPEWNSRIPAHAGRESGSPSHPMARRLPDAPDPVSPCPG
jgi:hypothetical protein